MSTSQKEDFSAVAPGEAVASEEDISVPLPQGSRTGLTFSSSTGAPLHVAQVYTDPNLRHYTHIVGKYVVALRLPGLNMTVSHVRCAADLEHLLAQTASQPQRQLVVSTNPPVLNARITRFLYVYEMALDEGARQHFCLDGFPPRIVNMQPTSPLNIFLRPGLICVSLVIPQRPDFQFDSGGFTGFAVEERMAQTSHVPGRWLCFTEENPVPPPPKTRPKWFDIGRIF